MKGCLLFRWGGSWSKNPNDNSKVPVPLVAHGAAEFGEEFFKVMHALGKDQAGAASKAGDHYAPIKHAIIQ
jgi:hypothetical protein